MKSHHRRIALAASAALTVGFAGSASATNGYFGHCIGVYSCGMGGAGIALPSDATNGGVNPALMARLGNEIIVAPAWFHPVRTMDLSRTTSGNVNGASGDQTSGVEDFIEGAAGVNYTLNSDFSIGLSIFGSGGMMTKYQRARVAPAAPGSFDNEVRYRLGNFVPTLSYRATPNSSYGIGLVLGYADFRTNMANSNFQVASGRMELEQAFGVGFRIGGLWDVNKSISLGATFASPVWFQEFDKYPDIFLGPVDTPWNMGIGLTWRALPSTDVAVDVKYIAWDDVRAIGTQPGQGGFGWEGRPVVMLGVQHRLNDQWAVRAGYSYGDSPIPDYNTFANALFPAVMEHHLTAGVTYKMTSRLELSASAFYAPKIGQTDAGTGDAYSQMGAGAHVDMYQYGINVGLKWKF